MICKLFLLFFCGLLFQIVNCVFWYTEILNFDVVQFTYFQLLFYISKLNLMICIIDLHTVSWKRSRRSTKNVALVYSYLVCIAINTVLLMPSILNFETLDRDQSVPLLGYLIKSTYQPPLFLALTLWVPMHVPAPITLCPGTRQLGSLYIPQSLKLFKLVNPQGILEILLNSLYLPYVNWPCSSSLLLLHCPPVQPSACPCLTALCHLKW